MVVFLCSSFGLIRVVHIIGQEQRSLPSLQLNGNFSRLTLFALRMRITLLGLVYIAIDVGVVPINLVNYSDIK